MPAIMNERIIELAHEVFSFKYKTSPYELNPGHHMDHLHKFAELIVRECANQCDLLLDHKISSEWSRGTHDCSRAIKKHFGVE